MKTPKCPGRPREFDPDQALHAAMLVFWRKGYEATSIADIEEATGISRPSLYATFGNKEELFHLALKRYLEVLGSRTSAALELPNVRDAVEALLMAAVNSVVDPDHPGCLLVVGSMTCTNESERVQTALAEFRDAAYQSCLRRLEKAHAAGELPADSDPVALARYLGTVMTGMTFQARSGATRDDLIAVVKVAMSNWPGGRYGEGSL